MVTGKGKQAIENHFDKNFELEEKLKKDGKNEALKILKEIDDIACIFYIRQRDQKGLVDVIFWGSEFIGNEYFVAMVGDTIYSGNVVKKLIDAHNKYKCSIIALERVPMDDVHKYDVIAGEEIEEGIYNITDLVEKPSKERAPSNLIITGAYLLSPKIFEHLKNTKHGRVEKFN